MPLDPRRHVDLEAVHNFRDLGGYPTVDGRSLAWGRVFRADGLYRLTEGDVDRLRPLGLRTVIDLRTADELSERGTFPLDDHPVDFHHLSIIDRTWDVDEAEEWGDDQAGFLRDKYHAMLEQGGDKVGAALRIISRADNCPVVFHCAAGKDRTGLVAGLLLAGLGVDDLTISADFALSAGAGERTRAWAIDKSPELAERFASMPPAFYAAHPESMLGLLLDLRSTHGSVRGFCRSLGVDDSHWSDLEDHLLSPA